MILVKTFVLFLAITLSLAYIADVIEAIVLKKSTLPYFMLIVAGFWGVFYFLSLRY